MAHDEQDQTDGWQTFSSWIDNLRESSNVISRYDKDQEFQHKLLHCPSNLERFKLIWNNQELRNEINKAYKADVIPFELDETTRSEKSIDESKLLRELGNKSFKEFNFHDALMYYTRAIQYAPYPTDTFSQDQSLALGLANRSAALFSLTRYKLCLHDVDLAIKYGYPESSMFKLLIRKVKCLHILSVWANDFELIKEKLRNILKNKDTKEFIKTEISNMFEFLDQTKPEDMPKEDLDIAEDHQVKLTNASKTISQASDCIEMSYDKLHGRYLIATKDLSFGRLLIEEEPFVCNLAPMYRESHCFHCFGKLHSCGIGCYNCTQILYCSEDCLNANKDLHSYECNKTLQFQNIIGVAYLVAHIIYKISFKIDEIEVYRKRLVEKKTLDDLLNTSLCDWPDMVYKNEYSSVLALMDHASDYDYDAMMGHVLTASYLMTMFIECLPKEKVAFLNDETKQLQLGSVVLRHLLQLQTNLISVLEQDLQSMTATGQSVQDVQEKPLGIAIYPSISLLNHSCNPNVLSIFNRNKFIARASKSIECGTQVFYCYGPSVARMSKKDRQQRLKCQYFFDCECECCQNCEENEGRALLCPDCKGPIIFNEDLSYQCSQCKLDNHIDIGDYLSKLSAAKILIEHTSGSESEPSEKIKELKDIEKTLEALVYWRNPLFIQLKSMLIECAESLGKCDLALQYCQEELNLCSKLHGDRSYEYIMIKLKMINFEWQQLYYEIEEGTTQQQKDEALKNLRALPQKIVETRCQLRDLLISTNIIGAESSFETEMKFLGDIQGSINRYLSNC